MRIAYIITRSDAIGGASIHVRDMATDMRERGHEVRVFIGGEGEVTEALERKLVPFASLDHLKRELAPLTDLRAFGELRAALERFAPDIISAHTSKAGFLGRLAAWSLGIPCLYTPHCWSFVEGFPKAKLYLWAERLAAPFGSLIVAVSEDERQTAIERKVTPGTRIQTIHNGMPDIPVEMRAQPELSPPRLCMIGRIEIQKDHATLLRALGRLRSLEWSLDLVGDGPHRPEVEAMAREMGMEDRVRFLGYRSDIPEVLSEAQIYLLISNWESFPRSILEAMRAGLPVIATNVGGVCESVGDGVTGHVVPKGDEALLTERLGALIRDPEMRVRMGEAGRRAYEEGFSFQRMASEYVALYEKMVNGRDSKQGSKK